MFVALASLVALANTSSITEAAERQAWRPDGGETIRFDVYRNGDSRFGTHVLTFERTNSGDIKVVNDIDLKVKIGPFTPFRYRHDSVEVWRDGELMSINAQTRKEGDDFTVDAKRDDTGLRVDGSGFDGLIAENIIPSSHWNIRQLFSDAMLSTETGELLPVETEVIGVETLQIGDASVEATRYRLNSELSVDLWYDAEGRWLKCAFDARGQSIEYALSELY